MLQEESALLIHGLLEHPEASVAHHVHREVGSVGWRSIFGHESIPFDGPDPAQRIDDMGADISRAMLPGGSIVDIFPSLKPVISRIAFLRRPADLWHEEITSHFEQYHCDDQLEGQTSVSGTLKQTGEKIGIDEHTAAWISGTLFFAAIDTSACALLWFLYAMILHPEAANEARKQLDDVVGDRPPRLSDKEMLPQIEAIVKEVLRWRPPVPQSVAHAASEPFEYDGYMIPQGAIIVANIYAIGRDPQLYADGDNFDPSRFIDESGQLRQPLRDSKDDYLCFGHGRRICVGKDLAMNSLWISIAHLLWAFDFKNGKDARGVDISLSGPGFLDRSASVEPVAFSAEFVPRYSDLARRLKAARFEE
ncbi:cytochrome P450 [Calocera viscosa TUFC12733]|uniref:Cytochrome P450 n=1 Tax=Calocera viscosa (strain TUFC12733) TaxID=1330018 RepID=A0A167RNL1_CALVF|nr:cytochrome P450 [Calocera viscosa TUFC12733]